jgi:hypothetical protein
MATILKKSFGICGKWSMSGLPFASMMVLPCLSRNTRTREGPSANRRTYGVSTLLRDLIAAIVVNRADQLAKYERSDQAFVSESGWKMLNGLEKLVYFVPIWSDKKS